MNHADCLLLDKLRLSSFYISKLWLKLLQYSQCFSICLSSIHEAKRQSNPIQASPVVPILKVLHAEGVKKWQSRLRGFFDQEENGHD
jgi:hypothetical protein